MRTLFGNFNNDNYNQDIRDDDHEHDENISYIEFFFYWSICIISH